MSFLKNLFQKKAPEPEVNGERFQCAGVQYFNQNLDPEVTDETLDNYFIMFKKAKKVYSNEDIDKLTEIFLFDAREGFYWQPLIDNLCTNDRSMVYRFDSVNDTCEEHLIKPIEEYFKTIKPLTRVDIQTGAAEIGCNVFQQVNWTSLIKSVKKVNNKTYVSYYKLELTKPQ